MAAGYQAEFRAPFNYSFESYVELAYQPNSVEMFLSVAAVSAVILEESESEHQQISPINLFVSEKNTQLS